MAWKPPFSGSMNMNRTKKKCTAQEWSPCLCRRWCFCCLSPCFQGSIARWIDYPDHQNYILWFAWILALDALAAIPFAKLRAQNKAKRFAAINMANICINIGLNLFFIILCPVILAHNGNNILARAIHLIYRSDWGIEYIFISNLVASIITLLLLLPQMIRIKWKIDPELWRRMFFYAFPAAFCRNGRDHKRDFRPDHAPVPASGIGYHGHLPGRHLCRLLQDIHPDDHFHPGIPVCGRALLFLQIEGQGCQSGICPHHGLFHHHCFPDLPGHHGVSR